MYLGRYYVDRKKWIAAINRFRTVIDQYDETIYAEEALYRLVEIYYLIGLKEESKKYAVLLGYNYQSSQWYEKSYTLFNKMYENNKRETEMKKGKQKGLLKNFNRDIKPYTVSMSSYNSELKSKILNKIESNLWFKNSVS